MQFSNEAFKIGEFKIEAFKIRYHFKLEAFKIIEFPIWAILKFNL